MTRNVATERTREEDGKLQGKVVFDVSPWTYIKARAKGWSFTTFFKVEREQNGTTGHWAKISRNSINKGNR